MTKKKANNRSDELLEKYGTSPEAVLGEKGLFMDLKKRIVERIPAGELPSSSPESSAPCKRLFNQRFPKLEKEIRREAS